MSASVGDRPVRLHGRLGRTMLAALALHAGEGVSGEHLIDAFWGDLPPATARQQVHNQLSRLRRGFREVGATGVVHTEPGGYRLAVDASCVDVAMVHQLRASAAADRERGQTARASATLRSARAMWNGAALGGVSGHLADAELPTLEELRLAVTKEYFEVELDSGSGDDLGPELTALVHAHPLSEPLHRLRVLALYRSGRRAEALAAFQEACAILRDELGVDPAPELRDIEAAILREDAVNGSPPPTARLVPAQLPPRLRHFVGRDAELRVLLELLVSCHPGGGPRVALLTGMAGVGKTALAVQAAAAASDSFPDGRLYANLRGFDARPVDPYAVLGAFLRALGVDALSQPADLAGRSAEFRTRTAGRRMLVLLDNAADEDQVEPLVPAEPACATLITSRSRLPGLDTPASLLVAPMPDDVAHRVLADAAGRDRLAGEPAAAQAIVDACAGMPLALRIAGARLATAPELSADTFRRRLAAGGALTDLAAGNKSVRGSLDASYQSLTGRQRQALRELARLGPGVFGSWLLAPLLDVSSGEAVQIIETLAQVSLLEPVDASPGSASRYRFHDLVRAYALTVPGPTLDDAGIRRATDRALAFMRLDGEGRAWVEAHGPAVQAVFDAALAAGYSGGAARLLGSLAPLLIGLDQLDECETAARRLGAVAVSDTFAQQMSTVTLGKVMVQRGRYPDAVALAGELLQHAGGLDPVAHVDALLLLGHARGMCEDTEGAIIALREALTRAAAMGDLRRQFSARFGLAEVHRRGVGDLDRALEYAAEALALADTCGDAKDRAMARFSLVRLHMARREVGPAQQLAVEALELVRGSGDPVGEAWCLLLTADAACAGGDLPFAAHAAQESITLARRLQRPDAEASAEVALARTLAAAGDLAAARAAGMRAMELTREFDSPAERRKVEVLLGELSRGGHRIAIR